jgi:hypothetical protein
MARIKGMPKTGGRKKGTPNKTTVDLKMWINELLDNSRQQIIDDIKQLEPHQRVALFEKLLSYAVPKQQSVSIESQIQAEYACLEKLLFTAPDTAINAITDRIVKLNGISNGKEKEN